jgi:hypothetical protein
MGRGDVHDASTYTQSDIEVRISNIARSADWIAAEYNNQSSPSTFYSGLADGKWYGRNRISQCC